MEQNFQTSFIPKKPILKESTTSARPVSIFLIVSLFVLFTVLLATGGLYFYKSVVVKNIAGMDKTLSLARNRFEPKKITELQTFDKRLHASSEILAKHITVTPIFNALEQITMKSVRFTKFSYDLGTEDKPSISIKMSGVAIGYRSIALQSDLFAKNKNLIDPVFSNLVLDNSGNVIFDLDFSVDPAFVNYKQTLMTQN
ncbi:MAG: hypothetical protein WC793_02920 [Candidatus Paceibacterota bacterium]|jgi:exopolysaccharide biosynthesis protein